MQVESLMGGHWAKECEMLELPVQGAPEDRLQGQRGWTKALGRNQGFGGRDCLFKFSSCHSNIQDITNFDSNQAQGE